MIITGQSTHSRHASRTHGVDMDWLCERIHLDSSMSIRYVRTTEHVAEMLPTGAVTTIQWEVIGAIVWHSRTATNQMSIAVFENPLCSAVSALISRTMSIAYRDWTLGRTGSACGRPLLYTGQGASSSRVEKIKCLHGETHCVLRNKKAPQQLLARSVPRNTQEKRISQRKPKLKPCGRD